MGDPVLVRKGLPDDGWDYGPPPRAFNASQQSSGASDGDWDYGTPQSGASAPTVPTAWQSVKKGLSNVFYEGPKSLYHAFADPAQSGDEDVSSAPWERGARAFNRILVDPSLRTQEKAQAATNPVQKAGYYAASAMPGSEWIASKGEQAGSGDIKGAAIETATTLAAPYAAGKILRVAGPPAVRLAARGTNAILEKAPGVVGSAAGAALGQQFGHPGIGAAAGYAVGRDILPRLRVPGEKFGLQKVGVPGVDTPGGVPPSGPNLPDPSSPYAMSGDQIPDAQTVTPRQLIPPARQLNAVNPDPFTPAPAEPNPAPYRVSGDNLVNPVTVTPREFIPPSRQLNAANPGDIDPMLIELNDQLRNSLNAGKQARAFPDPEILPPKSAPGPGVPPNGAAPAIAVSDFNNPPGAGATPNPPRTFTPPEAPAAAKPSIETPANPDAYYGSTPPKNLVPQHQRQMGRFAAPPEPTPQTAHQRIFGNEEPSLPADDDDLMSKLQKSVDLAKASKGGNGTAPQGGHAGNGVTSVEELNRSGTNYTVSKGGQVSYHGKSFAPESTPNGSSHVTVLSDGSFRINAGQTLTPGQELALKNALKK